MEVEPIPAERLSDSFSGEVLTGEFDHMLITPDLPPPIEVVILHPTEFSHEVGYVAEIPSPPFITSMAAESVIDTPSVPLLQEAVSVIPEIHEVVLFNGTLLNGVQAEIFSRMKRGSVTYAELTEGERNALLQIQHLGLHEKSDFEVSATSTTVGGRKRFSFSLVSKNNGVESREPEQAHEIPETTTVENNGQGSEAEAKKTRQRRSFPRRSFSDEDRTTFEARIRHLLKEGEISLKDVTKDIFNTAHPEPKDTTYTYMLIRAIEKTLQQGESMVRREVKPSGSKGYQLLRIVSD